MKKINILSLFLVILGLGFSIYMNYLPNQYEGLAKGMVTVFIAYPLIVVGIILFIIGLIISKVKSKKQQ